MKAKKYSSYIREITTQYKTLNTEKIHISYPSAVVEFLQKKISSENKEHFSILGVNNKNQIVMYYNVSIGTVTESIVHPREVFSAAILSGCSGIIITHNHPSGNPTPSREDIATTKRIYDAGKIIGIQVLDHIIVAFDTADYYSMKENGYLN